MVWSKRVCGSGEGKRSLSFLRWVANLELRLLGDLGARSDALEEASSERFNSLKRRTDRGRSVLYRVGRISRNKKRHHGFVKIAWRHPEVRIGAVMQEYRSSPGPGEAIRLQALLQRCAWLVQPLLDDRCVRPTKQRRRRKVPDVVVEATSNGSICSL